MNRHKENNFKLNENQSLKREYAYMPKCSSLTINKSPVYLYIYNYFYSQTTSS